VQLAAGVLVVLCWWNRFISRPCAITVGRRYESRNNHCIFHVMDRAVTRRDHARARCFASAAGAAMALGSRRYGHVLVVQSGNTDCLQGVTDIQAHSVLCDPRKYHTNTRKTKQKQITKYCLT
jgi:hypothetical protein